MGPWRSNARIPFCGLQHPETTPPSQKSTTSQTAPGTKLEAKILPEDWHRLIEGGASPNWYFNGGGVGFGRKLNGKVRIERPARLILGITDPKVFARFRDRNPLNLRRDNLYAYHVRTQEERDASIPRRSYYRMKG